MQISSVTAHQFYEERKGFYAAAVKSFKAKIAFSALIRLLSFIAFAVCCYSLIKQYTPAFLFFTLLLFAVFIFCVRHGFRLSEKKALLEKLLFINVNESGILNDELNQLDNGNVFSNHDGYAEDLDIFGVRSVYHMLNRCTTAHGKEYLSGLLKQPLLNPEEISQRQQAVQVLSDQAEKRQLLTAYGLLNTEEDGNLHSVSEWLQSGNKMHQLKWLQVVRWVLPLYNIFFFILYIANGNFIYLLAGVLTGWIVTGRYAKYIHNQHTLLSKKQAVLDQYANILKTFNTVVSGSSSLLKKLQASSANAYNAIGRLSKLSSLFDQRLNLLVNVFLNSIVLYDLQCILSLEKWKAEHKDNFGGWLNTVGDIECVNSLAGFAFNNPSFTYPVVHKDKQLFIETTQMAHPLISSKERIANDFEAGEKNRLLLVTGSNMSGKTTFLRTLGVNLVLAQTGAPVCAASFIFTPMEILTSIRVNDSLQEHTSYFMAELKRLKHIILHLKAGKPALVLIDEILRGTNSEDKTHGSEQFILQLIQYNCITLFATHDLTLASLENDHRKVISNYCFESIIQNDTLYFDYKLQRGVAKNKNASFLMKKMGIINE